MARLLGLVEMQAALLRAQRGLAPKIDAALYLEAEAIMAVSQTRVQVDTGIARSSKYVAQPETSGTTHRVEMGYGGAASAYLLALHEHLSEHSPPSWKAAEASGRGVHWSVPSTGPKFLEGPLREAAPHILGNIATRVAFDKS